MTLAAVTEMATCDASETERVIADLAALAGEGGDTAPAVAYPRGRVRKIAASAADTVAAPVA